MQWSSAVSRRSCIAFLPLGAIAPHLAGMSTVFLIDDDQMLGLSYQIG